MCGVAGIFNYHYASPATDLAELRLIRDYMQQRGPDGMGEWQSKNQRIVLGHRRLSIIDLSSAGAQPMSNTDQSLVVVFNGEIYNYTALRRSLEKQGYHFVSNSDTEVLLHLYAEYGEQMLPKLRGMFAFALWDEKQQQLLLARDPYGIKPLYYANDGWTVRFASQVKALLTSEKVSRNISPAGTVGFFLFGSVPEPHTLYQDIQSVPSGCYCWVDATGIHAPQQYYSISEVWAEAVQEKAHIADVQSAIQSALVDTVTQHLVADVPVGAFLSAGIDSGSLLGLMTDRKLDYPLQTVTLAFSEFAKQSDDESPLAQKMAAYYGSQHTTRIVDKQEFITDLPNIITAMDQPSIDGINIWFVSKAAKELGLKVAVSGVGGDELFGGYPAFTDIPNWLRWFAIPSRVPLLGRGMQAMYQLASKVRPELITQLNPKITGLLRYANSYAGAYLVRRSLFMPWELSSFLSSDLVEEGLRRLQPTQHIASMGADTTAFARIASFEASLYMRNQLLRDADWAGMAHSLEIRTPLVDAFLLKKMAPILMSQPKIMGKFWQSNSPQKPLPQDLLSRPRTGFGTPVQYWVNDSEIFNPEQFQHKIYGHWSRRWAYTIYQQFTA